MEVRQEFTSYRLNDLGLDKLRTLRDLFTDTLNQVEDLCGVDGREMALVRTKMEEASFFANKAMAKRAENQQA